MSTGDDFCLNSGFRNIFLFTGDGFSPNSGFTKMLRKPDNPVYIQLKLLKTTATNITFFSYFFVFFGCFINHSFTAEDSLLWDLRVSAEH